METPGQAGKGRDAQAAMASLAAAMQREMDGGGGGGGYLSALHADVSGRMTKALQGKPRFQRWGKHYLRALVRAHEVQICTNFMDTGLQHYAGQLFAHLRDVGDKVSVCAHHRPFFSLSTPPRSAQRHFDRWELRRKRSAHRCSWSCHHRPLRHRHRGRAPAASDRPRRRRPLPAPRLRPCRPTTVRDKNTPLN
jgi:hypothetical protein